MLYLNTNIKYQIDMSDVRTPVTSLTLFITLFCITAVYIDLQEYLTTIACV